MIFQYVSMGLGALLVALLAYHNVTISSLEDDLTECQRDTVVEQMNYTRCKSTLKTQNLFKAKVESELAKKRLQYEELKNNPEKIYIDVIRYLPKEYKDENCSTVLDSVRSIDFKLL